MCFYSPACVENPKDRFSHEVAQFGTAGQTNRERERERERKRERERENTKNMIDDRSNHFYTFITLPCDTDTSLEL